MSFFDLHVAIQDAMGWFDSHLHQFFIGSPYGRDSVCLSYPYPDVEPLEGTKDERKEKLLKYLCEEGQKVHYEYDFGDGWMHQKKPQHQVGLANFLYFLNFLMVTQVPRLIF